MQTLYRFYRIYRGLGHGRATALKVALWRVRHERK